MDKTMTDSLDPETFMLWTPPAGRTIKVGPEQIEVSLPELPLPILREDLGQGDPSDDAVGRGVYDYLRQFPDCPANRDYAELLREAYPHYLADIGAQIVMLDNKEVDVPYLKRKITYMKILALLDPDNPGLLQQLGRACYDLALSFPELPNCRPHLLKSLSYLQRSLRHAPEDPSTLNILGEIDYLLGDYPAAARRWKGVIDRLEDGKLCRLFSQKISALDQAQAPDHPLIDDLEALGAAVERFASGEVEEARLIAEQIEEQGVFPQGFPSADFFGFLGLCREKSGDPAGAFEAYDKALDLDPEHEPAREGKDRITDV